MRVHGLWRGWLQMRWLDQLLANENDDHAIRRGNIVMMWWAPPAEDQGELGSE